MAISEAWSLQAEPREAMTSRSVDLSQPIPSWNTPEYPAEWPRDDEMSTIPRHGFILHYLLAALSFLLRQRGRPFGVHQDIGLHFIDADGFVQKCDPDLIVMPFPNTGRGSLRRRDMPCPPDCVFEVASPSTVQRDLGIKKDWYAWMGVREYWILDPVDSGIPGDPALFKSGILLPDGPLMGWELVQDRYEPLESLWDEQARSWTAHSPVLDCGILFSQTLHQQHMDGGYRIVDLQTGVQLPSTLEVHDQLEERQAQLEEKDSEILGMVATVTRIRYGDFVADELMVMMQRSDIPVPGADTVQAWMTAPTAERFLELARRYFGLQGTNG